MAIDSREEECFTLQRIRPFLPATTRGGKPPHQSIIYRWITRGLKARDGSTVKLEALICGGAICTSREAVERFFTELTRRSGLIDESSVTERRRESARTSRKLAAAGLKGSP